MLNIVNLVRSIFTTPAQRRYVFIVTYGRSGSTLLMNLINSSEGCCIRGENNAALHSVYSSYRKLAEAKAEYGKNAHRASSPWHGIDNIDVKAYGAKLVSAFVEEVIRPGRDDYLCGFKEIRHSREEIPDLAGYLEFLFEFFPDAKVIFNHRKLADVAVSKWWADMPKALDKLEDVDNMFWDFPNSEYILHFSYDKAISDMAHVENMFKFLEVPFDEQAIKQVFSRRHSY